MSYPLGGLSSYFCTCLNIADDVNRLVAMTCRCSKLVCHAVPQDTGSEDYSSFPTFGKGKVTDMGRDGTITFTFEEDDDVDAQSLSSQLLAGQ